MEVICLQVNLINIASKGKSTMLRLAIFPAASSGFFSDTTVMVTFLSGVFPKVNIFTFPTYSKNTNMQDIVSFLSEHRVQLPENFGSYQVVRWNFERPSRRY